MERSCILFMIGFLYYVDRYHVHILKRFMRIHASGP